MKLEKFIRQITPPVFVNLARRLREARSGAAWEFVPEGWEAERNDAQAKGWSDPSILEAYRRNWPVFLKNIEGPEPLGVSLESSADDRHDAILHNINLTFGYVLALASRQKSRLSVLDWGGGVGHFYLLARKLLPELELDYHCKDLPAVADFGRTLVPEVTFHVDEGCLERRYDLVISSSSLQYARAWRDALGRLARATQGHLLVTSIPVVATAPSFAFVQRPYAFGYETEYIGWCLNRRELVEVAATSGLELIRELVVGHAPVIRGAPEQNQYRGYLFRPRAAGGD